jgi:hypothetical protein
MSKHLCIVHQTMGDGPCQLCEIEAYETAFEWFAEAHPHEAYQTWPERFWNYFHAKQPEITRERMEALLLETA